MAASSGSSDPTSQSTPVPVQPAPAPAPAPAAVPAQAAQPVPAPTAAPRGGPQNLFQVSLSRFFCLFHTHRNSLARSAATAASSTATTTWCSPASARCWRFRRWRPRARCTRGSTPELSNAEPSAIAAHGSADCTVESSARSISGAKP